MDTMSFVLHVLYKPLGRLHRCECPARLAATVFLPHLEGVACSPLTLQTRGSLSRGVSERKEEGSNEDPLSGASKPLAILLHPCLGLPGRSQAPARPPGARVRERTLS